MELSLLNGHGTYLWRYLHVFFGIIWIGHLYYFNFVQTPFFAETDANTKNGAIQKLVPRALWWFRWGAKFTFITGLMLLILGFYGNPDIPAGIQMFTQWGSIILPGALMGTIMYLNVWMIIWQKQKIVIASTNAVISGGKADPRAADAAARAAVASRTNTLFSIPMLFFMIGTAHMVPTHSIGESSAFIPYWIVMLALITIIELNAIFGKLITPLKTVRNVILSGFVLTAIMYAAVEIFLVRPSV